MNRSIRTVILAAAAAATLSGVVGCGNAPAAAPEAVPTTVPTQVRVTTPEPAAPAPDPAPRHVGRPTRVLIPAIKVDEHLTAVGLEPDGAMATPDFGDAGWYDEGPRPGAPGPAVIVAHVHGPDGDDVFAELHTLAPGDRVVVRDTRGVSTFVVDSVERARKEALPYDRIWKQTTQPVLRLITCGGSPDPVTRMYPDNTIVYAHLAS